MKREAERERERCFCANRHRPWQEDVLIWFNLLSFLGGNPRICQRADGLKKVLIEGTNTPSPSLKFSCLILFSIPCFLQGEVGISWDNLMRHDSFFATLLFPLKKASSHSLTCWLSRQLPWMTNPLGLFGTPPGDRNTAPKIGYAPQIAWESSNFRS